MNFIHTAAKAPNWILRVTRLPPFEALIAFEAAARLGSMTAAAAELGLTQSAVSHRVRRLEAFMGTQLLRRRNSGLSPTPAGQALLEGLQPVLNRLSDLRARCRSAAAPDQLRVGINAALADNWLVRRLPEFTARHRDIGIELVVVENETPERAADCDLRILWVTANEARASSTQRPLFREHVFPVCDRRLLPANFTPGDASVLTQLPLLHKRSPGQGEEWSWSAWFARHGLKGKPKEALRFTSLGPAVAAALAGAGVVLARTMLVQDALNEGRLVRVLPPHGDQLSAKVHVVRWPARHVGDARVRALAAWLVAAAQATRDTPEKKRSRKAA
jgi:LysR family transcriptional regulator, glycine cleavage system transcriptional activator